MCLRAREARTTFQLTSGAARHQPSCSSLTLTAEPRASKRLLGRAALPVIEQLRGSPRSVRFNEVAAAVCLPACLIALRAERLFLAVADGVQAVGGDAKMNKVALDGRSAAIAKDQVVFGGAAFVAMALDGGLDLRVFAEEVGGLCQSLACIGADVRLVEVEVGVLHFLEEERTGVRCLLLWRRRWRRRSNGYANAGVRRTAGTAGGDRVGRGIRRRNFG